MIDILFFGRCCVIFLDAARRCFSLWCPQVLASQIFSLRNPFKLRIYNWNGREIGPSRTRHAKWTWKPVVLLFNDFMDYMGLYILMSIYHMYFIYIHKNIYPPWSSHHIAYYCHRILQQYKYRCAFLSRLWYASGFLTRWTPLWSLVAFQITSKNCEEIDMPPRLFLMPMSYIMLLGAVFGGIGPLTIKWKLAPRAL